MPELITPPPSSPPRRRARPVALAIATGAVAMLGYALAAPPAQLAQGTAGFAVELARGLEPASSALWLLAVGFAGLFPAGADDLLARLRLVSLVAGAAAVALSVVRSLAGRAHDAGATDTAGSPVEIVAVLWGVTTVALSRSFVAAATSVGPTAGGTLLAVVMLALAERVARVPGDRRSGMWLAFAAGLGAGGPLAAAAIGWPMAALVLARAWRHATPPGRPRRRRRLGLRGAADRWPVLAAVPFIGGLGIGVTVISWSARPADLSALGARIILLPVFHAVARLSTGAVAGAAVELGDQIGVLAAMVAFAGLSSLRRTSLILTLWSLSAGLVLRAAFGAGAEGNMGLILSATALALPLAAGIVRLAERLGRARLPAAAALGIIVATWPFLAQR